MKYEPVIILDTLKYLLASLTALGVVTIDADASQWVVAVVGSVLTVITTVLTRNRVTPTARATATHDYR